MYIRIISFGTNWWAMRSRDTSDPFCFRRRAAYFNAAALMSGRRLHRSAIFPGQVRFNAKSEFDPDFPLRAVGKTFLCSEPHQFAGKVHLLFERRATAQTPDAYLVTLRSAEHGSIRFAKPGWKSAGVRPISISLRGQSYEAMLLLGGGDWVESDIGRWQIDPVRCRIRLDDAHDGVVH
jgi:hypothetical protein